VDVRRVTGKKTSAFGEFFDVSSVNFVGIITSVLIVVSIMQKILLFSPEINSEKPFCLPPLRRAKNL
jgi:hypothetical protein